MKKNTFIFIGAAALAIIGIFLLLLVFVINPLKNENSTLKSTKKSQEITISALQTDKTRLTENIEALNKDISGRKDEIEAAKAELAAAQADAEKAQADAAKAQEDAQKALEDTEKSKKELTTAQNEIKTVKKDLDAQKTQLAKAQKQVAKATDISATLKTYDQQLTQYNALTEQFLNAVDNNDYATADSVYDKLVIKGGEIDKTYEKIQKLLGEFNSIK